MRCTRGARRLRRCGHYLFVLMDSGHLSATTPSFGGTLRSAKSLVAEIPTMISSRTISLLLPPPQTDKNSETSFAMLFGLMHLCFQATFPGTVPPLSGSFGTHSNNKCLQTYL